MQNIDTLQSASESAFFDNIRWKNFSHTLAEAYPTAWRLRGRWLSIGQWLTLALFTTLLIADGVHRLITPQGNDPGLLPLLAGAVGGKLLAYAGVVLSSFCFLTVLDDLLTYRPLLIQEAYIESPSFEFLWLLGKSEDIGLPLNEIKTRPPRTLKDVADYEARLNRIIWKRIVRSGVKLRILQRFVTLVFLLVVCLALLWYFANQASGGTLLTGISPSSPFVDHLYFTVLTFFTVGLGDVHPAPGNSVAQTLAMMTAITPFLTLYLGLAFFINAMQETQYNLRNAVHHFVISKTVIPPTNGMGDRQNAAGPETQSASNETEA